MGSAHRADAVSQHLANGHHGRLDRDRCHDLGGIQMTDCCDDAAWLEERIAAKKALIIAFETAITTVAGGAQSYSLDTGQTRQVVTKANLTEVRNLIGQLESDIATLQMRLYGCGRFVVRPGW